MFPQYSVRCTTQMVAERARHVAIDPAGVKQIAELIKQSGLGRLMSPSAFDAELHFFDGGPLTVQYLLAVDALNFCFWPDDELQYEHLAQGLKAAVIADPEALSAARLAQATGDDVQSLLGWPRPVPLQAERARLLREVGRGLQAYFNNQAANLVLTANKSAVELVALVAATFAGFQDHCIYRGHQVHLLKRAQIFVADVWGAFQGQSYGAFHDIDQLTMFADYRVPVVLRDLGVLKYSSTLSKQVDSQHDIPAGSEEECEIRACTVVAVEQIRQILTSAGHELNSVQVDWWLWHRGEACRNEHAPHHRTLTIYY